MSAPTCIAMGSGVAMRKSTQGGVIRCRLPAIGEELEHLGQWTGQEQET